MVTAVDVMIIRPNPKQFNSVFFMTNMNREATLKIISKSVSGTSHKRISRKNLEKTPILAPTIEEQTRIGTFFQEFDNLIAIHQRKLEALKEQKKGLLQQMFPKDGANIPELRFPEFTDVWEQRKLGEGVIRIGDGIHGTPKYKEDGKVSFINGNNLVNGEIVITEQTRFVDESQQTKSDKSLNKNTILMSINGTIGNLAWYRGENIMLGKSAAYIESGTFDKKFIYQLLQTTSTKLYFQNNLTGSTIKNLGLKTIRETPCNIPVVEEQAKIGLFFEEFDNLIAIHQRKLEALQEQKKGLLQQMFV